MRKLCLSLLLTIFCSFLFAQEPEHLPTDYLTKEFHTARREALRRLMPLNSVAVIFAYPERTFSNDVNYVYHQNPDLYYFSGYNEPNSVLLIFKDPQTGSDGKTYTDLFFIQKRDSSREQWTGKRMGIEKVQSQLGFTHVYNGADFKNFPLDFSKFDHVLFDDLSATAEDNQRDTADLHDLIESFKKKASIRDNNNPYSGLAEALYTYAAPNNIHYFQENIQKSISAGKAKTTDTLIDEITMQDILNVKDATAINAMKQKMEGGRLSALSYKKYTGALRQIKTPEEIALLRKSVVISAFAHNEVMKAIQPGMSERDLQAIFEFVHQKYGAEEEGYPPIVGAGNNGCTLHYEENSNTNFGNDMVLMDVASEYHGYSADVTRTVPSSGKFTPEQKAIYDIVYQAQEEVFKLCKPGFGFDTTEAKAAEVLGDGLLKLGIIHSKEEVYTYYPHGCSHYLGLDVHDKGQYGNFAEGMAFTVEPGIYIPIGSACNKKWWGIAVRIEDDVIITKNGFELLSKDASRKSEEVEKMVAQKSVLNDYRLPALSQ